MEPHCVYSDFTVKEVIENFEANTERVAVVLNHENRVIGVVSQGDIIRALSAGKNLYAQIFGIVRPSFLYLTSHDMDMAYQIFKSKKITMLPVIDDGYFLKDVITLDDIYAYLEVRR